MMYTFISLFTSHKGLNIAAWPEAKVFLSLHLKPIMAKVVFPGTFGNACLHGRGTKLPLWQLLPESGDQLHNRPFACFVARDRTILCEPTFNVNVCKRSTLIKTTCFTSIFQLLYYSKRFKTIRAMKIHNLIWRLFWSSGNCLFNFLKTKYKGQFLCSFFLVFFEL